MPEQSKPVIIIPHSRNPQFVGRDNIFEELDDKIFASSNNQRKTALCGLGGVGKSQIALEYAYRVNQRLPEYSIFWVYASSTAQFEKAYQRISDECDIPGRQDSDNDLMQLVRTWLETEIKMPWLMIIDNVDDVKGFFHETHWGKSLREYVPETSRGYILYTTRSRNISQDLVEDSIHVSLMTVEEARTLLDKKMGEKVIEEEKDELLKELDYLPLAITQAAAFMAKEHKTISQYLTLYRHSDPVKVQLLSHKFADHESETQQMKSIATTWIISFEYIRNENPLASKILSLMSFLDRQCIPAFLFRPDDDDESSEDEGENSEDNDDDPEDEDDDPEDEDDDPEGEDYDPVAFTNAVGMLEAFLFVVANEQDDSYNMHRLVRTASRTWLANYDEDGEAKWASRVLSMLSKRFPNSEPHNLRHCAACLPHAEAILDFVFDDEAENDVLNRASLLFDIASYFFEIGTYEAARKRIQESFHIRRKILGLENPDTLSSLNDLAVVFNKLGKYEMAEEMHQQVVDIRKKMLGLEHPKTLLSMDNLALVLQNQGKYEKAEQMHQQIVKLSEKVWGSEHPDTLISMNNLALVFGNQGKYEIAGEIYAEALTLSEKVLGLEHPDTLITMGNLASALDDQGKYEKAEEMHRQVVKLRVKILGSEHPDTLTSMSNLAPVLDEQGKYEEAEKMYKEVVKLRKKILGSEHPDTLTSVSNYATFLADQGKYEIAEEMHQQVLMLREKILGPEHPDTLTCMNNLALTFDYEGKYEVAGEMYQQVVELNRKMLGPEHPSTLTSMSNFAMFLSERGKQEVAGEMYQQVLMLREKVLGPEHPDTLHSKKKLANFLDEQGKYEAAGKMYQQVAELREKVLGPEHPETLRSQEDLELFLEEQRNRDTNQTFPSPP